MALRSSVINKGNQNSSKIDPRLDLKGLSENEFNSLNLSEPTIKNPSLFKTFESGKSQITSESTTIDPTVLGLRNQGLSSVDTSLSNLRADREKTIGDRGTFVERRTSGLRDTLATQKEQLGMRLEQTGVTGEFGKQTKENFAASAKQKLATGQQLAVDELASISDQFDRTEGNLLKLRDSIDFSKFTQDDLA